MFDNEVAEVDFPGEVAVFSMAMQNTVVSHSERRVATLPLAG